MRCPLIAAPPDGSLLIQVVRLDIIQHRVRRKVLCRSSLHQNATVKHCPYADYLCWPHKIAILFYAPGGNGILLHEGCRLISIPASSPLCSAENMIVDSRGVQAIGELGVFEIPVYRLGCDKPQSTMSQLTVRRGFLFAFGLAVTA